MRKKKECYKKTVLSIPPLNTIYISQSENDKHDTKFDLFVPFVLVVKVAFGGWRKENKNSKLFEYPQIM